MLSYKLSLASGYSGSYHLKKLVQQNAIKFIGPLINIIDWRNLPHVFQTVIYFFCDFVPFVISEYNSRNCDLPFLKNQTFRKIDIWFPYSFRIIFGIKVVGPEVHNYMIWGLVSYAWLFIIFHAFNFCTWETSNRNAMLAICFWWHLASFGMFYHAITKYKNLLGYLFSFWCYLY